MYLRGLLLRRGERSEGEGMGKGKEGKSSSATCAVLL